MSERQGGQSAESDTPIGPWRHAPECPMRTALHITTTLPCLPECGYVLPPGSSAMSGQQPDPTYVILTNPARVVTDLRTDKRDGLSEEHLDVLKDEIFYATDQLSPSEARAVAHAVYNGDWLARREAAAAAEAVEKALGPVSELADALEAEDDYVRSWKLGRQLRAATARGREEAGR